MQRVIYFVTLHPLLHLSSNKDKLPAVADNETSTQLGEKSLTTIVSRFYNIRNYITTPMAGTKDFYMIP